MLNTVFCLQFTPSDVYCIRLSICIVLWCGVLYVLVWVQYGQYLLYCQKLSCIISVAVHLRVNMFMGKIAREFFIQLANGKIHWRLNSK